MIGPTHFLYTFPHSFNSFQTSLKPPDHETARSWSSKSEGTRGGLGVSFPLARVCVLNTALFFTTVILKMELESSQSAF